ncbi:MAG: hypothetical protein J6V80_00735 [Clostridia bacterium]|nr:hypothetical protein [Clostridia bacterium]
MSKIRIECFGNEAELISFSQDGERTLQIDLGGEYDGYISIGRLTSRIKGASCSMDMRGLEDGEYTPRLIVADMTVDLPKIQKQYGIITPTEPELPYTLALSLRERRLRERVDRLEKRLEELTKRIEGERLFGGTP